jgi:F420-non-reducing hydrogenase iron-sulfur subunit
MAINIEVQRTSSTGAAVWQPRIIGFLCFWCSYTGADGAGTARLHYPPNIDIVKLMCSGRIDPELIVAAYAKGADGVLVSGCHIGDCHYLEGNHKTMVRMPLLKSLLVGLGIEPERFRHEWVSASEGAKFAQIVREMTSQVQRLGPLNWPELMASRGVGRGLGQPAWGEHDGH